MAGSFGYVGAAVPIKTVWASGVTLFDVAARQLGDATQWYRIAAMNGLTDPWVSGSVELKIPLQGASNGGILGL
jgi:hypothetical protein